MAIIITIAPLIFLPENTIFTSNMELKRLRARNKPSHFGLFLVFGNGGNST